MVEHTSVWDPCPNNTCGSVFTNEIGDLLMNCPRGNCLIVVPVPEICQNVVNCPRCGPGEECPREFTFEVTGVDAGWGIRFVNENGQTVPGNVRRSDSKLAITLRSESGKSLKGALRRYTMVLERNRVGKERIDARLRVTSSTP